MRISNWQIHEYLCYLKIFTYTKIKSHCSLYIYKIYLQLLFIAKKLR